MPSWNAEESEAGALDSMWNMLLTIVDPDDVSCNPIRGALAVSLKSHVNVWDVAERYELDTVTEADADAVAGITLTNGAFNHF